MAQINLLPWREHLREERKRAFLTTLVGFVLFSGASVFAVDRYFVAEVKNQIARNDYLKLEIQVLDAQVAEIRDLREQKQEIQARMDVITGLQGTRPVIVRVFDEIVKSLPEGVYYTHLERVGNDLSMVGVAESYAKLTELMRRLDKSEWFKEAVLTETSATEDEELTQAAANTFSLRLKLELPRDQLEA